MDMARIPALVIAWALILSACNGEAPLTESEFTQRANDLCARAVNEVAPRFEELPEADLDNFELDDEALMEGFKGLHEIGRDLLVDIREGLEQIETSSTADLSTLLHALTRDIEVSDRWLAAFESDDLATLDELANEEIGDKFMAAAEDIGIEDCADLSPPDPTR